MPCSTPHEIYGDLLRVYRTLDDLKERLIPLLIDETMLCPYCKIAMWYGQGSWTCYKCKENFNGRRIYDINHPKET